MPRFRKRPLELEARRARFQSAVETPTGLMIAQAGDWILTDVDGRERVWSDKAFRKYFEPLDDEARREMEE